MLAFHSACGERKDDGHVDGFRLRLRARLCRRWRLLYSRRYADYGACAQSLGGKAWICGFDAFHRHAVVARNVVERFSGSHVVHCLCQHGDGKRAKKTCKQQSAGKKMMYVHRYFSF